MTERKAGLAVTFEAKAVGETGEFDAYVSDWRTDRGMDRVMPGAFTKSLAARPAMSVKMLRDHNPSRLCGTWLAFSPDSRGLHAKGRLILGSHEGADAYALMKAGALDACSIGYVPVRARKDHTKGERLLEEVDLREVSLVTWGMNESALISSVKHSLTNPAEARRLVAALDRATAALKGK